MKIYNKNQFIEGIFMVLLGAANLITDMIKQSVDMKGIILTTALFLFGFDALYRSLSRKLSRESKLEDWDERNQFIELKAKRKAFQITQAICFSLLIGAMVAAKLTGYEGFTGIALGLALAYAISVFTNLFTAIYYEWHY